MAAAIGTTEGRGRRLAAMVLVGIALTTGPATTIRAADPPYDDRLLRLAEILGALHWLRPLCGAVDEPSWRDEMQKLITAEEPSPERQRRFTERFNTTYRGLAATHHACEAATRVLIGRYEREGADLAAEVVRRWGHP